MMPRKARMKRMTSRHTLAGRLLRVLHQFVDTIMPRRCEQCGVRLGIDEHMLCMMCSMMMPRLADHLSPYDNETVRRMWGRLEVERGASVLLYTPHTPMADVIYRMKYANRPDIAEQFGILMASEMMPSGFFDDIDLIIPLPLHRRRERERGYNQSLELARSLSQVTHIPVCTKAVKRTRYTISQASLSHYARSTNVLGAFSVVDAHLVRGKHVLLVDDIITTGASLYACGKELLGVEGVRLSFLTLGRTAE